MSETERSADLTGCHHLLSEENAALLSAFICSSSDGVAYIAPDCTIRLANEALARQIQLPLAQVVGRPISEVMPDWMEQLGDIRHKVGPGSPPFKAEAFPIRFKAHLKRAISYWRISFSAVSGPDGSIRGYLLLLSEVTTRKGAEAERERLIREMRLLLESTDEGIFGSDIDGNCTFINRAGAEMLGYTAAELVGKQIHDTIHYSHPDGSLYPAADCPLARATKEGHGVRVDSEVLWRHDGSALPVEYSSHPILVDGVIEGAVVSFIDITERKLAAQFHQDYISVVSHDLRGPLSSLMVQTQLLSRTFEQRGMVQEATGLSLVLKSAKRLEAMIDDLADSALLESGHLELHKTPVDLRLLVSEIAGRVGSPEDRARIKVQNGDPVPTITADAERVERVIVNLITNALKFSSKDTPVELIVAPSATEVMISVRDWGVGIPQAEIAHVFERFYRATTGRRASGLGLGLYSSRLIVEAHGGRIWVDSDPGRGSIFYFTLPLDKQ